MRLPILVSTETDTYEAFFSLVDPHASMEFCLVANRIPVKEIRDMVERLVVRQGRFVCLKNASEQFVPNFRAFALSV